MELINTTPAYRSQQLGPAEICAESMCDLKRSKSAKANMKTPGKIRMHSDSSTYIYKRHAPRLPALPSSTPKSETPNAFGDQSHLRKSTY